MKKISLNKYFKSLAKIHAALILVQLFFIVAALFLRAEDYINAGSGEFTYFSYLLPVLVFAGLFAGNRIFNQKVKISSGKSTLGKKLTLYRKGVFIRHAFWIIPSISALAAYLLTGNWIYIALSGLIVIVFFTNWPTLERVKHDLDI
jgi:uncharacterized membrane protein